MNAKAAPLILAGCLLLSGCVKSKSTNWYIPTPEQRAEAMKPGPGALPGTPKFMDIGWELSPQEVQKKLRAKGYRLHMTRRTKEGMVTQVWIGVVYGREATIVTQTQGKLLRLQVQWKTGNGIDQDYKTMVRIISKIHGPSVSLFTPKPPTDRMYRAAAGRELTPITGWVFANGYAVAITVCKPYAAGGDTSTVLQLSYDSRDYRIMVGTFTKADSGIR